MTMGSLPGWATAVLLGLLLGACRPPATTLTISAAVSTQEALEAIGMAYQQRYPGADLRFNFGASGALAQQILQGAPVDLFLSASSDWMDRLEQGQRLQFGSRQPLLGNRLVLVARPKNELRGFEDLATDTVRRLAIGEPDSVPAGRYGRETLAALNLLTAVEPKLVYGKNVRQVLAYVETGSADGGLVYASDAARSGQVSLVAVAPLSSHSSIRYPVALVDGAGATAQDFLDFLNSDTAQQVFERYGFEYSGHSSIHGP